MITSGTGGANTSETVFQEAYKCCQNTTATAATHKGATPKEVTPTTEEQDEFSVQEHSWGKKLEDPHSLKSNEMAECSL